MRVPYGKLWTEFFPSFHGPSAKRVGHENKEVRERGSTTCSRTKQTRLIRCLLYGFVDYSGKITKLSDVVTCDREMKVCKATYEPQIDQSQHTKSVSHIIRSNMIIQSNLSKMKTIFSQPVYKEAVETV